MHFKSVIIKKKEWLNNIHYIILYKNDFKKKPIFHQELVGTGLFVSSKELTK